jgi:hypothetical protein
MRAYDFTHDPLRWTRERQAGAMEVRMALAEIEAEKLEAQRIEAELQKLQEQQLLEDLWDDYIRDYSYDWEYYLRGGWDDDESRYSSCDSESWVLPEDPGWRDLWVDGLVDAEHRSYRKSVLK